MNKRLTDDVRDGMKEAFDNLVGLDTDEQYKLFLSEQAGWEEVERLKELYKNYLDMYTSTVSEKNILKGHLQDAINTLQSMYDRPVPTTGKWFRTTAYQTIQRIQEEGKQS